MSEQDELDAQPPATRDFYEALGPKTTQEKAAIIWRLPSPSLVVVPQDE